MAPAITIMQLAQHRLGPEYDGHALTGAEFEKVRLPILGGCEVCRATVAAHNSCPSKTGYIRCLSECIGDEGYQTVEEADLALCLRDVKNACEAVALANWPENVAAMDRALVALEEAVSHA